MRSARFFVALLLILATVGLAGPPRAHAQVEAGQTFSARVVDVTDGDTFDVKRSAGGEVTIRLHGVDGEPS